MPAPKFIKVQEPANVQRVMYVPADGPVRVVPRGDDGNAGPFEVMVGANPVAQFDNFEDAEKAGRQVVDALGGVFEFDSEKSNSEPSVKPRLAVGK